MLAGFVFGSALGFVSAAVSSLANPIGGDPPWAACIPTGGVLGALGGGLLGYLARESSNAQVLIVLAAIVGAALTTAAFSVMIGAASHVSVPLER